MYDLKNKTVLVTGGEGFLGRYVIQTLKDRGAHPVACSHKEFELTRREDVEHCLDCIKPHAIIHCAVAYASPDVQKDKAAAFFYDNLIMGLNVLDSAHSHGVEKVVVIGTPYAYPGHLHNLLEDDFWNGLPVDRALGYAMAKKTLAIQGRLYSEKSNMSVVHVLPANLYGPHDAFEVGKSHLIATLMREFCEARDSNSPFIELWGDGSTVRQFLYASEAAEAVVRSLLSYDDSSLPLNLAHKKPYDVKTIAPILKEATGFTGEIRWDTSKVESMPIRVLDTTRMENILGWTPKIDLEEGIQNTFTWFEKKRTKERMKV